MQIEKKLFIQMREVAQATCGNSYLMDDGEILSKAQYKALDFIGKLRLVMCYNYATCNVVKI